MTHILKLMLKQIESHSNEPVIHKIKSLGNRNKAGIIMILTQQAQLLKLKFFMKYFQKLSMS